MGLKILAQMANTKCVSGMVELALHSREAFRKLYASVFLNIQSLKIINFCILRLHHFNYKLVSLIV